MHTKIALIACCAGFYDLYIGCSTLLLTGSQTNSFIIWGNHLNYSRQIYLMIFTDETQNNSFLWCLPHYRVCMRIGCASPSRMASRKLISSMRHREWSIIAVWSYLPMKCSCKRKNNGCTHVYSSVLRNGVKYQHSHLNVTECEDFIHYYSMCESSGMSKGGEAQGVRAPPPPPLPLAQQPDQ